jgi:hypothetical protein
MNVTIVAGRQWPHELERLMRDLPDWFGIESSIVRYAEAARTLPTTAALHGDEFVGGCVVQPHNPRAAEIGPREPVPDLGQTALNALRGVAA